MAACDEGGEQGGKVNFAHFLKSVQNLCNLVEFDYRIMQKSVSGETRIFLNKENMAQQIQLKFNDPAPDIKLLGADGSSIKLS